MWGREGDENDEDGEAPGYSYLVIVLILNDDLPVQ